MEKELVLDLVAKGNSLNGLREIWNKILHQELTLIFLKLQINIEQKDPLLVFLINIMKKLLFPNKLHQLSVNKEKVHKECTWERFDFIQ
jgi:hypothetical protein